MIVVNDDGLTVEQRKKARKPFIANHRKEIPVARVFEEMENVARESAQRVVARLNEETDG